MAHHFAHALTRSVGHGPACVLDLATCPIAPDDRFLLCSDGLTGMVGDAEIAEILAAAETPELAAARLADTANEHGGNDNVTAVVAWKTR
jgi:serine/threonine protein phosphatase PrpC